MFDNFFLFEVVLFEMFPFKLLYFFLSLECLLNLCSILFKYIRIALLYILRYFTHYKNFIIKI